MKDPARLYRVCKKMLAEGKKLTDEFGMLTSIQVSNADESRFGAEKLIVGILFWPEGKGGLGGPCGSIGLVVEDDMKENERIGATIQTVRDFVVRHRAENLMPNDAEKTEGAAA